ncbi:MAG: heme lyase CcmF/NrfE family subunit, partial [Candidatus Methylomirabilales bacterium]
TLASWIFMTLGLLLGGLWSYGVLGWGGYWAWDPVENVSLLPWLTATAFLHSVMAEERRGMLKVWNLSLVVGTFALTIFGTFLTRGSILYSVHAFAQSIVGPLYLGFLTLVLLVGFGLIALRSQLLRSERTFDTPFSRESTFLGNNLLLIVLTFTVFLGTIYPLIAEATAARQVSVGGPYFNRTTVPVVILLLGLMSVGPLLPWRAGSASRLGRRLQAPAWAGALTLAGLSAAGISNLPALLALGFAAFAAVATVSAMLQSIRSLKSASGLPLLQAAIGAVRRNRRFHGGMIVHLGLVLVAIAVTVSSSFDRRTEATIGLGETFVFAGYGFRFEGVRQIREPHRRTVAAELSLLEDAQKVARLTPLMNFYPSSKEPIGTPSIRTGIPSNLFRDVYVSVSSIDNDKTTASFRIYVNPGVNWLWFGGALMMLGAILAAWPSRRVRFLTPIPEPRPERVEVIR